MTLTQEGLAEVQEFTWRLLDQSEHNISGLMKKILIGAAQKRPGIDRQRAEELVGQLVDDLQSKVHVQARSEITEQMLIEAANPLRDLTQLADEIPEVLLKRLISLRTRDTVLALQVIRDAKLRLRAATAQRSTDGMVSRSA